MAQFQAYNNLLISAAEGIINSRISDSIVGYEFYMQYPSYRGTFLSCIENMEISIDGERVQECKVYFHINGKQFQLSEFKDLYTEYWFILEKARVLVIKDGGLMAGDHEVSVKLRHRIPYTGYFGNYMVLDSFVVKTLPTNLQEVFLR